MGVIYKLKQEVIDYILELKKLDEALSCRKISELASTRFQKEISKSSVNAILKESSLSSPIGRRGRQRAKEEKFKIPEHRKEQIFINIPAALLVPQPSADPAAALSPKPLMENAGTFFLKAAEWQIKRQGILRFLCEKYNAEAHEEKIFKIAESFLFLPIFGATKEDAFLSFDKKSFWELNDIDMSPTTYQKAESFDMLRGLETKKSQVLLEHGQIFSEASFFQILLEDGTSFCLDCQSNSSWDENNVHCDFSSCLDKSFDFLSRNIINNTQPVILRQAAGEGNFSASFLSMIAAFENLPGKRIKRVDLMTSHKETVSSFEKPLHKKRYFIVGIYDCEALARKVLGDKKQLPKTFQAPLSKAVYGYTTATTAFRLASGEQMSANIIFLNAEKESVPRFGILTNTPFRTQPIEEVIRLFLEKWPMPAEGQAFFKARQQKTLATSMDILSSLDGKIEDLSHQGLLAESSFLSQAVNLLLLRVHDYARRHFFPAECMHLSFEEALKKFYRLSGEVFKEKDIVKVKISRPPQETQAQELAFAAQRINESAVFDPQGRRIIFLSE